MNKLTKTINIKDIIDEDFVNYKKPSMFIATSTCTFKCEKEDCNVHCQNSKIVKQKTIKENSFLCIEDARIKKYKIVKSIELNKNDLVFTLSDDVKEISGVGESKYITVFVCDVIKLKTIEQKKLLLFLYIKGYLQEIKTSVNNFKEFVLGYENSDSMNDFEFVRYINKQFDILEEITPFKCLAGTVHTSLNYFYLKIKVVNKSSNDFICWMEEDPEQCKEFIEKFDENKKLYLENLDLKEKTMNYIKEHKKNRMSIGDITNE